MEERLDAGYYTERELLNHFVSLSKYIKVKGGKRIPLGYSYSDSPTDYLYLRVENINEFGEIDHANFQYISKEVFEILRRYELNNNDLLISIAGTIGRVGIFKSEKNKRVILTENCAKIHVENTRLLPEYLKIVLQTETLQKQIKKSYIQTTIPKLGLERIYKLKIPSIPTLEKQKIIISVFDNAVKQKQQKEQQAKDLLNSIDDYLLQELGIQLPTPPANTIANRMFTSSWQKVAGNRFDALYNNFYFEQINNAVKNGKLKSVFLRNISKTGLIKGYLPNADEKNGNNKVVQINSINEDGTFNLSNVITAKNVFTKHQRLQKNDILVVITGATIGKIGFWNEEDEYYLGGDIVKFQTEATINPYYVFSYLRSKPAQIELKRNITGATNGHLSPHDINNLLIPVPTSQSEFDLINTIAKELAERRENAYRLLHEAQHQFNQTKQEIERMILE